MVSRLMIVILIRTLRAWQYPTDKGEYIRYEILYRKREMTKRVIKIMTEGWNHIVVLYNFYISIYVTIVFQTAR